MIGKSITELDSVDNTNNYIAKAIEGGEYRWGTAIMAHFQSDGRGQRGASWQSAKGKNLTFSFALPLEDFDSRAFFNVSRIISLALVNTLRQLNAEKVQIKWPNDILVDRKKVAGILIENKLSKNPAAICGIGLNVNQTEFIDLPQATSLSLQRSQSFDLPQIFNLLLINLNKEWSALSSGDFRNLKADYDRELFSLNENIDYEVNGEMRTGLIVGTTADGRLIIKTKNQEKAFLPKGLKLLY